MAVKVGRALAAHEARRRHHLLTVRQTAPRRFVVQLEGTPLWQAGPSRLQALGALLDTFGDRLGFSILDDVAPCVRVLRADGRPYVRPC